jgi:hypothetical protein
MSNLPPEYFKVLFTAGTIRRNFGPGLQANTWIFDITKGGLTATKNYP